MASKITLKNLSTGDIIELEKQIAGEKKKRKREPAQRGSRCRTQGYQALWRHAQ